MNNLRKVNKVLFVTLLVFSLGVFANYSRTASKYWIQFSHDKIVNSVGFKTLSEMFRPMSKIVDEKVEYTVKFYRTVATGDPSVKSDVIDFVIDKDAIENVTNTCEITSISNYKGKGDPVYNDDKSSVTLTYTDAETDNNTSEDDEIVLVYTCDAEQMMIDQNKEKSKLRTAYKAYEKVDDEPTIVYFGGLFETDEEYVKPTGWSISEGKTKLIFHRDDVVLNNQILDKWISEYVNEYYSSINGDGLAYDRLESYLDLKTLSDPEKANSIKGVTYNKDTREYTFDRNVLSLAYTSFFGNNKPTGLYFLNADKDFNVDSPSASKNYTKEEVEELYSYYYDTYYKPTFDDEENAYVTQYIKDNGGISSVVVDKKSIPGVNYVSNYVTINKYVIYAQLYEVLDPLDQPVNDMIVFMQIISGRISHYVKKDFGVDNFDSKTIEYDQEMIDFFEDNLYKDTNMNMYYYIPIENNTESLLRMRVYYDGSGWMMHLDAFGPSLTMDTTAQAHVFRSTLKDYKVTTSTTAAVYNNLRKQFEIYYQGIDKAYGTKFGPFTGSTDSADLLLEDGIDALVNAVNSGDSNITINKDVWTMTETAKSQVIGLGYKTINLIDYGTLTVEYKPTITVASTQSNNAKTTTTTKSSSN